MRQKFALSVNGIMLLGVAALPAMADADRTPAPGGVYRLKPGIYVAKDTACETAPNVAIRDYNGKGISTPHSRSCRVKILSKKGSTYRVEQSCLDAGAGPAKRFRERQTVFVDNAIEFTQTIHGSATAYRYCPAYQLPEGFRKPAYYPDAPKG